MRFLDKPTKEDSMDFIFDYVKKHGSQIEMIVYNMYTCRGGTDEGWIEAVNQLIENGDIVRARKRARWMHRGMMNLTVFAEERSK